MQILIRAALFALSLATITPVANADETSSTPAPAQQTTTADWANG